MMKGTFFNMDGTKEPVEVAVLEGPSAPRPGVRRVPVLASSTWAWTPEFSAAFYMPRSTREAVAAAFKALPDCYQALFLEPPGKKEDRARRFSWWEGILQGLPEKQREEALNVFRRELFADFSTKRRA